MADISPAERIIVPLDVPDEKSAIALIDRLPDVTFWKVGLELFISSGPSILTELKNRKKRIFLDLKLHDIPNTMAGACRSAGRYGVDLLTVHATAGSVALSAAQGAATESAQQSNQTPPTVIAVTVLTSIDPETLANELDVTTPVERYARQLAQIAQQCGLGGAVCSPHEAAILRDVCGDDFCLVCPGVRPDWAQKGDQQRAMTPSAAIQTGATYLVIGRPITQADDPAIAFGTICDEIAAALN